MKQDLKILLMTAILLGGCTKSGPLLQPPYRDVNETITGDGGDVYDPRVDILFVIDNSGSMSSHQNNLIKNIDLFTQEIKNVKTIDFHIGVTSTDMSDEGRLLGNPTYVDNKTQDLEAILGRNMNLGTNGGYLEASFDPVVAALTEPRLSNENKGFYRKGAYLAVIFITDAEDQSNMLPNDFLNFLAGLKTRANKVFLYGAIVPTGIPDSNCPRDEWGSSPKRIEEVLNKVINAGNNILNLCTGNFGQRLAELSADIVNRIGNIIYLRRVPAEQSIKVYYGQIELPNDPETGWSYVREKNAILLGHLVDWNAQPPGSYVRVVYDAAEL